MALYAIGDVQGCDAELEELLQAIASRQIGTSSGLWAIWSPWARLASGIAARARPGGCRLRHPGQ